LEIKVPHSGWLYITNARVFFHSKIPPSKKEITLKDIISLDKKSSLMVNNAIEIRMKDGKKVI
jgi:hypothetical protein